MIGDKLSEATGTYFFKSLEERFERLMDLQFINDSTMLFRHRFWRDSDSQNNTIFKDICFYFKVIGILYAGSSSTNWISCDY